MGKGLVTRRAKSSRTRRQPERLTSDETGASKRSKVGRAKKAGLGVQDRPIQKTRPSIALASLAKAAAHTLRFLFRKKVVTKNLVDSVITAYIKSPKGKDANAVLRNAARRKRKFALENLTRTQLSERMGERGALEYLIRFVAPGTVTLRHADEKEPYDGALTPKKAWKEAVTFRGAGVADVMYWDGASLHVVEAKGGSSQLKTSKLTGRKQAFDRATGDRLDPPGPAVDQGTMEYLLDIAWEMHHSPHSDNRSDAGDHIIEAMNAGTLVYATVSTSVPEGGTGALVQIVK